MFLYFEIGSKQLCYSIYCSPTIKFVDTVNKDLLRTIAVHVGTQWRDLASDLGLAHSDVLHIEKDNPMSKTSELAYHALDQCWKQGNITQESLLHALISHKLLTAAGKLVFSSLYLIQDKIPAVIICSAIL